MRQYKEIYLIGDGTSVRMDICPVLKETVDGGVGVWVGQVPCSVVELVEDDFSLVRIHKLQSGEWFLSMKYNAFQQNLLQRTLKSSQLTLADITDGTNQGQSLMPFALQVLKSKATFQKLKIVLTK